ncbi:MAG: hypothetical protein IT454_21945 [Planctomycetes bacterium]|nr:hypothetical protein [Planctomycetota bacterium]
MGTLVRLLSFRLDREGYQRCARREIALGVACAWLAGIGRYWDHPSAGLAQKFGLGSVLYVFALAALLWATLRPFPLQRPSYANVLAAVALTSPLAWLYALPVERWYDVDTAITLNIRFLQVVAAWRVLSYLRYLRVGCAFSWPVSVVLTLLPLCVIVTLLAILNLEHAVFDLMAGIDRSNTRLAVIEAAYRELLDLVHFALLAVIPLFVAYVVAIVRARRAAKG